MTREFVEAIARSQKKVFTSIRGTDITITPSQRPDVILAYQTAMKYLKGVHYLSHELRQASHKLGIRHGTERVIYQGIDFRKFVYNATPSQDKLRIATVGRLHYVKGLEFFLLACYYLKREGIEFEATVVGEGSDLWRLKHLCRYLELEAFVTFFGTVAHDDMGQLLSRHNVYVHTHLVTGLSNTMLEAIASNLTVVCFGSNLASYIDSGISELIREVPKGDVLALKQALVNVRNSQSFGNDQTKVNRALETFSLEKHVDSFKEFLGFKQLRSE
jgi:colanic acid/amylovoran biosynthesis glycosyltransferase